MRLNKFVSLLIFLALLAVFTSVSGQRKPQKKQQARPQSRTATGVVCKLHAKCKAPNKCVFPGPKATSGHCKKGPPYCKAGQVAATGTGHLVCKQKAGGAGKGTGTGTTAGSGKGTGTAGASGSSLKSKLKSTKRAVTNATNIKFPNDCWKLERNYKIWMMNRYASATPEIIENLRNIQKTSTNPVERCGIDYALAFLFSNYPATNSKAENTGYPVSNNSTSGSGSNTDSSGTTASSASSGNGGPTDSSGSSGSSGSGGGSGSSGSSGSGGGSGSSGGKRRGCQKCHYVCDSHTCYEQCRPVSC